MEVTYREIYQRQSRQQLVDGQVKSQYENLPQHCLIYHGTRIKGPDAVLEDTADDSASAAQSTYILPCSTE